MTQPYWEEDRFMSDRFQLHPPPVAKRAKLLFSSTFVLHLCAIAGVILAFPCCSFGAQASRPLHWVGTWGAAPLPRPLRSDDRNFSDVTLWQTIHASLGGTAIRIQLTNEFGTEALRVSRVRVSLAAAMPPRTVKTVTFHGRTDLVIPAGARMVSDPVDLSLPAGADLHLVMYLPVQAIHVLSFHSDAQQSCYMASGDVNEPPESVHARRLTSWFFVREVDVATAEAQAGAIVAFGDSITDGARASIDKNRRWPDVLAQRLLSSRETAHLAVLNEGIGGNRILQDATSINALARFDRDVLALSGVRYAIVLEGTNDIAHITSKDRTDENATAEDLIAGLEQLAIRAHATGIKVFAGTITPNAGSGAYTDEGEQMRQAVNRWIRTNRIFDGVVDFDEAIRDPQHPSKMQSANDSGDHLHPNDEGYRAMAASIDLSLFTAMNNKHSAPQLMIRNH